MSLIKKIFGTSETEFGIGTGANKIRLYNNSKAFQVKDKDDNILFDPAANTVDRTWGISGEIKVPSGDTDFIIPTAIWVPAGKTVTLNFVEMFINSGTSATFKIKQKTTAAETYTDVATGLVADTTPTNKTALTSNNSLAGGESGTMYMVVPEVTAVSGTPKNLSITINYTKPLG